MNKYLLTFLTFLISTFAMAQNWFAIRFDAIDEYTREEMVSDSLLVDVMRTDSTALFKTMTFRQLKNKWFEPQNLLLKLHQRGFISQYVNVNKPSKRVDYLYLDKVVMCRDLRVKHNKVKELNEVTVTASVLKMVHKGDTIIYNAEAFQLDKGSMLDQLVRALPGVELRSGGRIYVNGRYVESLMLNGRDFFKGNPTVALANLPSYTVSKIKVYEKESAIHRIDADKKKPLVMDVGLKKEYLNGWIANAEAGYGTDLRYVGRLFGLNFNNLSRTSIFGNINNTNDATTPGEEEDWNPNWQAAGIETTHKAGINYMLSGADNSWEFTPAFVATRSKKSKTEELYETLFLPSGTMNRNQNLSDLNRSYDLQLTPNFKYDKRKLYVEINPSLRFHKGDADYLLNSAMSNNGGSLNSESRQYNATNQRWEGNFEMMSNIAVPSTPDYIGLNVKGSYQDNTGLTKGYYKIDYPKNPNSSINQGYHMDAPQKSWEVEGTTDYWARIPGRNGRTTKLKGYYQYGHSYRNDIQSYYDSNSDTISSLLPSDVSGRNMTLNLDNSYNSCTSASTHTVGGFINQYFKGWSFTISPDFSLRNRRLDYRRFGKDYRIGRTEFIPGGTADININKYLNIEAGIKLITPSLLDLLDIADRTNPLFVRQGNSDLTNGFNISVNSKITLLEKLLHSDTWPIVQLRYNRMNGAIARSAKYDPSTGVTTYRPENIDGNWNMQGLVSSGYHLDRNQKFTITTETNLNYINSVDMVDSRKSEVRTFMLDERLKFDWKIADGVSLAAIGNVKWRNSTSPEAIFNRINAIDYDYGVIANASRLPWNMSFKTDITWHSRRGYSDARLNDTRIVWNARVAKSVFDGKLSFALDGYDILGQLSNVTYDINAQGRTEARYNTLPRYAMFHMIYHLNIQPKSK